MIYFIQQGDDDGPIKIGYAKDRSAVDVRLKTFQTGHSATLNLLGVLPGDLAYEAVLHERFAAVRVRGEWFEATDALMGMVRKAQLAAGPEDIVLARQRWLESGFLDVDGSLTTAGCIFLLTMEEFARQAGAEPDHPAGADLMHQWAASLD